MTNKELACSIEDITQVLRKLSEKEVFLRNTNYIRKYLLKFPDIINVLQLTVNMLIKQFPNAQLIIDMYRDPEINDNYLVIYIRMKRYNKHFTKQLESVEAKLLDLLSNRTGWLQITTDFKETTTGGWCYEGKVQRRDLQN